MNEPALRSELAKPAYTVMTDVERLAALKLKNIPKKVSIPVQDIKQYMMLTNTWLPIKNGTTPSTIKAMDALIEFPSFDIPNPAIEAIFIGLLDGLIADVVEFTAVHKAEILAMGTTMDSTEDVLGFVGVTLGDVQRART